MRKTALLALLSSALLAAASSAASADFAGQTILGPLGPGSVVAGDTTGATDDNDGIFSGMHIFDVWTGPDDVWQVDWPGGDLEVQMTYNNLLCDLDLFLYTPVSYDDSGNYSIMNSGVENVIELGAAAGTYYVIIDAPYSDAGAYTLSILPEPTSLAILGLGLIMVIRRR